MVHYVADRSRKSLAQQRFDAPEETFSKDQIFLPDVETSFNPSKTAPSLRSYVVERLSTPPDEIVPTGQS
jgi:hypothetical protein